MDDDTIETTPAQQVTHIMQGFAIDTLAATSMIALTVSHQADAPFIRLIGYVCMMLWGLSSTLVRR